VLQGPNTTMLRLIRRKSLIAREDRFLQMEQKESRPEQPLGPKKCPKINFLGEERMAPQLVSTRCHHGMILELVLIVQTEY
jgi:hypothetical protein